MASIDKVRTGWRARWRTPDGHSRSKTFKRRADAERHLTHVEHSKNTGGYADPSRGRQLFLAFADEWADAQDWKETSRESWTCVRARLEPLLGRMPLAAVDQLVLKGVRRTLAEKYARSTVTTTMSYALAIMRAAHASRRIDHDPTRELKAAPKARGVDAGCRVGPEQVPTRVEALAILEAAPPCYRAAIGLGLAGLRVGEVLGMDADGLDLEHRTVTVNQQLQRVGGRLVLTSPKAEKARTIKVPDLVALELRRHLRDHYSGSGLLFTGRRDTPMMRRDQFYSSAWHPALIGAGLSKDRFVFHSLRHFCASTLLAEGAPLTAVAGHLGDTVETVSRVYVHWLRDDRDVPADVLDRVLAPVSRVTVVSQTV